jgi:DNA repair protein RecO (recombination protein O)
VPVLKMHFYLKFLFQQGILTAENWMGIFLKTNMADSNQLAEDASIQKDVALNLYFIETITNQYLKTAENH